MELKLLFVDQMKAFIQTTVGFITKYVRVISFRNVMAHQWMKLECHLKMAFAFSNAFFHLDVIFLKLFRYELRLKLLKYPLYTFLNDLLPIL